jgi:transposase InsO family protein
MVKDVLIGRTLKGITDQEDFSLEKWPSPDLGALAQKDLERFLKRKEALTLYLQGAAHDAIYASTAIQARFLNRMIRERCMHIHPDGRIYGWRALIPNVRIAKYQRHNKVNANLQGSGTAGALATLLQNEPAFEQMLRKQIIQTCSDLKLGEIRQPRHALWAWFLKELRRLGYETRNEWPFTVKSMGYMSLCRYADAGLNANPIKAARIVGGPQLEKKMVSGDGIHRPVDNPYDRVEMDAHKLDARFVVLIPQLDGGWSPRLIHRLWVIVLLDVASRAVLGYHLSLRFEVNKEDITLAIKNALTRWHRKDLTMGDQAYFEGAALPSGHHERHVGLCWNETSVDGALAETCKTVKAKLQDVVGSSLLDPSVGFAQRRSKDDRPFIESFFKTLASRGLQRLSNTTGAKVQDKQGRDPAKVAVLSEFQLEYAAELLDALIANYNATPHTSLGYRSPLQMLDFYASSGRLPTRHADPNAVQGLLSVRKLCFVRGGYAQGRRPYVNFLGATYSNEELAQRHDLVGRQIWVINHLEDDSRIALATTTEGARLGVLRAHPPWHRTPHNLTIRSAINAMVRNRRFTLANGADAVTAFMEFVETNAHGKLPIHPSYLELKRLLLEHTQFRSGDAQVATARAALVDESPSTDGAAPGTTTQANPDGAAAAPVAKPSPTSAKKVLPPLRMAAN